MKNKERLFEKLEVVVYIAVICYLLDIIILGGGDLTRIFGISSKMIFFAIAVVLSGVMMLFDIKRYITNKSLLTVAAFMIIVALNAVRGMVLSENISMSILVSDVKGFLNFLMVIPMIYVLNSKERVMRLVKIVTIVLTILAGGVIILGFYNKFPAVIQNILYRFLNENTICGIAGLTANTVRVFFHTASRLFFGGFLFALGLSVLDKRKILWMVSMVLQVIAIILSFTRSIYLGLFVVAVILVIVVLLYYKEEFKILCRHVSIVCVAVVCAITLISAFQSENVFEVAINRCILGVSSQTPSGDSSVDNTENDTEETPLLGNLESEQVNLSVRAIRTKTSLENIAKSPLIGNGLGTINDPNGDLIEYFYLDLLSKVGVFGLIIFLAPFLYASLTIWKNKGVYSREQKIMSLLVWGMVIYLLVISYFNPCMNTTTGLCMYSLLVSIVIPWKEESKQIGE